MTELDDDRLTRAPDRFATPKRRRPLWALALIAFAVMSVAAWQLRDPRPDAPTATEAIDSQNPGAAGDRASGFEVSLRNGEVFSLERHLASDGRPVLLNLWASWCIPCRNEMPLLDDVAPTYPSVLFLGVAVNDTRPSAEDFVEEIGVSYSIGFDEAGTLTDTYPAPAMPVTYVIGADGTVRGRFFGELTADRIAGLLSDVS